MKRISSSVTGSWSTLNASICYIMIIRCFFIVSGEKFNKTTSIWKKVLLSPTEPLLKWQRVTLTLLFVNNITGVLMKIRDSLYWEIKKNYFKELPYKIRDYHEGSYNELLPIHIYKYNIILTRENILIWIFAYFKIQYIPQKVLIV